MRSEKPVIPYDLNAKRGNGFINRVGQRFSRLLVQEIVGYHELKDGKRKIVYRCKCDCGNEVKVRGNDIVTERVVSCGCNKREKTILFNKRTKTKVTYCTKSSVYQGYKKGAKDRGIEWHLDWDFFFNLTQMNCHYCGQRPHMIRKARNGKLSDFLYNGVDRVDSDKDYTKDNVVPCCKTCNRMKRDLPLADFRSHILKLARAFTKKELP